MITFGTYYFDWAQILVMALGSARITLLVTRDSIGAPLRNLVYKRGGDKLSELISCPDCLGVWVSVAAIVGYAYFGSNAVWVMLPFAATLLGSLVSRWYD